MRLTVQHRHVRSSHELDALIEDRILALQPRLRIDEATVRMECRHEASPAFSVQVHLVTPGPDVFAERREHTLRAAIRRVMDDVEAAVERRLAARVRRAPPGGMEPTLRRAPALRR